jgi:hypothetical protein
MSLRQGGTVSTTQLWEPQISCFKNLVIHWFALVCLFIDVSCKISYYFAEPLWGFVDAQEHTG